MKNKSWLGSELPRQKLLQHGIHTLCDTELLVILLGTGSKVLSVESLAHHLMEISEGSIHSLGKRSMTELMKIPGIGEAKAATLVAALELSRRRTLEEIPERIIIRKSEDCFSFFSFLSDYPHEEFWILLLRRNNGVIGKYRISTGGISGTVADTRMILKKALEHLASSIVLCHNHPSGSFEPSQQDITLTRRLRDASKLMEVDIVEHIIIGERGYYSFADNGTL